MKRLAARLLAGVGVLWGAATLTFVAIHFSAGDPVLAILGGPDAIPTPQQLAQVREEYPTQSDGSIIFPFPRFFFLATR